MMHRGARIFAIVALPLLMGACAERQTPVPAGDALLAQSLRTIDEALRRGDVDLAQRAWHGAYSGALASRHWEAMIAVGDAYLRIGEVGGFPRTARTRARQHYMTALFRARAQRSVEGVLRASDAFAAVGDREIAAVGARIAEDIARARDSGTAAAAPGFAIPVDGRPAPSTIDATLP